MRNRNHFYLYHLYFLKESEIAYDKGNRNNKLIRRKKQTGLRKEAETSTITMKANIVKSD